MQDPWLAAVMGPTGSGKTALAESLAEATGALLVNADAFQIYRGFDIGTNKPEDRARYHLIDIRDPGEEFGVGEWVLLAQAVLTRAFQDQRPIVVVGGTGFYIRALFEEYVDLRRPPDPAVRAELMAREQKEGLAALVEDLLHRDPETSVDLRNPVRVRRALERLSTPKDIVAVELPAFRKFKFALNPSPEPFENRLRARVNEMFEAGWPAEVEGLLKKGVREDCPAMRAIGYQCIVKYLRGAINREQAESEIFLATRQYAKRQRTWLRSEPRLIQLTPRDTLDCGASAVFHEAMQHLVTEE
ncbi:MAG: tRNA (adenosine(37)-N6)-dimethylallyltransferase MiaA [Fimbriimonadaceae bacterium]|nr:tRNA (adenosine(37)-N6)-dimethylallyltransferase MiaA [Fimbriimonadaceae bacterium]QYK55424.1 MAG: tRNA (adenosine(37)-N6)-dimethylallyltransferase MiaA [Fimbriimonadaceae bacterium]